MSRPGYVLEVDDRTPPLVVPDGDGFRLERFPLGTKVVYPAESHAPVVDVREAINACLDSPLDSDPLSARLWAGMKLTIAFDDISSPLPRMRPPDIRGRIIEAVLSRAAKAGVDEVSLVCARGLNRRMTEPELQHLLGERVFRSFFPDGRLLHHDAEDPENLSSIGRTDDGEIRINAAAASADLLVFVHIAAPTSGGAHAVATGLGSAATISQLSAHPDGAGGRPSQNDLLAQHVSAALNIFQIEAVLNNDVFAPPLQFLARREWEWSIKDQATWLGLRRGLALTSAKTRRRLLNAAQAGYAPIQIAAGDPAAVTHASQVKVLAQQVVEVGGQTDVGIIGVAHGTPYSVNSVTNPILAAWMGLGSTFNAHTGQPVVRQGGALILYHPMPENFSGLHHPSYIDFFADVLTTTTEPGQIQEKFEAKFASDPWYTHLYRSSYAFHGVHPLHRWYQLATARAHCGDIIWVGAHRPSVERLGFRAASTLADALEIVSSTVGRTPSITYLHSPPPLVADVR
ncbi:MAG: DUF2088 domain-containing protein [Propionibacteriaceae bacterium]|nr:DUF2088 domain-containing protein [Propionibacteriaceae bacterium]